MDKKNSTMQYYKISKNKWNTLKLGEKYVHAIAGLIHIKNRAPPFTNRG